MINLDEFVNMSKDKAIDWDGYYSYQCMDLVESYNERVMAAPPFRCNAKELANNPQPAYYEYKINYPWYVPPKGAIAVWSAQVGGGYGHAGIVLTATLMKFTSLDQNWDNIKEAKEVNHTYGNVLGFLVPRAKNPETLYSQLRMELKTVLDRYPAM